MKLKPTDKNNIPVITLPWLIFAVLSMLMFLVFLIAMYFNFHAALFFALWIWVISAAIIYSGILKRKLNKLTGNIYIIAGVLAFIGGLWIFKI